MKLAKKQKRTVRDLLNGYEVRNGYTGSGRYTAKSADHAGNAFDLLRFLGLNENHFKYDNDAPRGGWSGYYIKLNARGKRLSIIKKIASEFAELEAKRIAKQIERDRKAEKIASIYYPAKFKTACANKYRAFFESGCAINKRCNKLVHYYAEKLGITMPHDSNGFWSIIIDNAV